MCFLQEKHNINVVFLKKIKFMCIWRKTGETLGEPPLYPIV